MGVFQPALGMGLRKYRNSMLTYQAKEYNPVLGYACEDRMDTQKILRCPMHVLVHSGNKEGLNTTCSGKDRNKEVNHKRTTIASF